MGTYVRLASVDHTDFDWTLERAATPDPKVLGSEIDRQGVKLAGSEAEGQTTLEIASGTTWELGADLELKDLGLSVGISGKGTYERAVEYAYTLPKGRNYVATRYASFPAYVWTVE
jgi:hypothetical protein